MEKFSERVKELIKNRFIIILFGVAILFSVISVRLFSLQIIHGEEHQKDLKLTITRELTIPASRGNIYDRYGRPLATNEVTFSVKIDNSVKTSLVNKNQMLLNLVLNLQNNGYSLKENLPITNTAPYSFKFGENEKEKTAWLKSIGIKKSDISAEDTFAFLCKEYDIPESIPLETKRQIISLAINISDKNLMLSSLIEMLEKNGEVLVDDLPISESIPYVFLFEGNDKKEQNFKENIGLEKNNLNFTADETINYLTDFFKIPSNFDSVFQRKLISLNYSLYLERYRKYQPIVIAYNISDKTVAEIEENQGSYPGVTIDTASLRRYPQGEYFSHILGYIRKISDSELEEYKKYNYTASDIVGKTGIEKVMELNLKGSDGEMLVEVDASGRRINSVKTIEPSSGKDIFLTIDQELQKATSKYLEEAIRDTLISKLNNGSVSNENSIPIKEFFISLVECNTISSKDIYYAQDGEQKNLKDSILEEHPDFVLSTTEDFNLFKETIIENIQKNKIPLRQLLIILHEQGIITGDENYLKKIRVGAISPLTVIREKLMSGEIRPGDTNLDPCSGSVVVSDINTGEVLALVTYPSYDNNQFVNTFNNEYYNDLLNDPTTPMVNRPLSTKKAPGSTFKMITAIAALETGIVTPSTLIRDLGVFTKAGVPYPKCWIGGGRGSHGLVNVAHALEVSCNYYFYEAAYRMGNAGNGDTIKGITTLNEYMAAFGLNDVTGIEIGESAPNMATPEYKRQTSLMIDPELPESKTRWSDGDTIRAAIGQSVNNYTTAHMNKYIATLANGGTRYKMHLIGKIDNPDGTTSEKFEPVVENILEIKPENLEAVYKGMLLVTQGSQGTLRNVFKNFPVDVAAKSGTAQEDLERASHTWFVCFAPYDDPQISVSVMIPFGEHTGSPSAIVAKNVISEYMGLNYKPENNYMENVLAK